MVDSHATNELAGRKIPGSLVKRMIFCLMLTTDFAIIGFDKPIAVWVDPQETGKCWWTGIVSQFACISLTRFACS